MPTKKKRGRIAKREAANGIAAYEEGKKDDYPSLVRKGGKSDVFLLKGKKKEKSESPD